jgi:hypothetical protein
VMRCEYTRNILYECVKIRQTKIVLKGCKWG